MGGGAEHSDRIFIYRCARPPQGMQGPSIPTKQTAGISQNYKFYFNIVLFHMGPIVLQSPYKERNRAINKLWDASVTQTVSMSTLRGPRFSLRGPISQSCKKCGILASQMPENILGSWIWQKIFEINSRAFNANSCERQKYFRIQTICTSSHRIYETLRESLPCLVTNFIFSDRIVVV